MLRFALIANPTAAAKLIRRSQKTMSKTKTPYAQAKPIADKVLADLAPYCQRIEIAGSLRRKKPEVGDIEIVCIPKITWSRDLFGEFSHPHTRLELYLSILPPDWKFIKDGPRFKQVELPEGITLDLFSVLPPAQWGVIFAIRTGPAEFSKWIVTPRKRGGALPSNCKVKNGGVWRNGAMISMPEEEDFLSLLGLAGLPPEARADPAW